MHDVIPFNAENNLTVDGTTAIIDIDARIDATPWASLYDGFVTLKAFRSIIKAAGDGITDYVFRILSPGGNAVVGNAIASEIKQLGEKANTVSEIHAAGSAATIVALAANTVKIASNGQFFIHQAQGYIGGTTERIKSYADMVASADAEMVRVYAEKSSQSEQQIRDWMAVETWFTAARCVELGFADELIGSIDGLEAFSPDGLDNFDSVLHAFTELRSQFRDSRVVNPPAEPTATDEEPDMAATLKELKTALPKADNDFLVEQLEAEATVEQATNAWANHLQAKLEESEAAKKAAEDAQAAAEQKAAEAAAKPPQPGSKGVDEAGNDPNAENDDDDIDGTTFSNPTAEWKKRLRKRIEAGETRADAVFDLMQEEPELYEAYLAEHEGRINRNPRRGQKQKAAA